MHGAALGAPAVKGPYGATEAAAGSGGGCGGRGGRTVSGAGRVRRPRVYPTIIASSRSLSLSRERGMRLRARARLHALRVDDCVRSTLARAPAVEALRVAHDALDVGGREAPEVARVAALANDGRAALDEGRVGGGIATLDALRVEPLGHRAEVVVVDPALRRHVVDSVVAMSSG